MRFEQAVRKIGILGSRGYPSTYGGYETLVRVVAPMWVERGLEVTVYCRSRGDRRRMWVRDGVICRWTPGVDNKSASTLTHGLSSHIDASRRDFDAALVLNVANGFFLPLLNRAGIGCVLNTDGIEWERGKWGTNARRVFRAGARIGAKSADVLVSDSQAIASIWKREFGVDTEFVPYGAPVLEGVGSNQVREMGFEPGRYVLVVARLIPENNVDLILDAIEILRGTPAVIVGDANFDSPTERRLRVSQDSGSIRWLGHVSDQGLLNQLWANAGVYVHGHSVGGTNPALLQAMGAGAPVLALDTPFNREVVVQDDQLFPPDKEVLARMIGKILKDPDRAARWREQGRSTVVERYSWNDVAERYLEALEMARRRRRSPG